ncbi:MAG: DUF881 domain-containing protein [Clostridia bacterium]|nr:DUF881 domain-containing protein [Clostridia bacterium]
MTWILKRMNLKWSITLVIVISISIFYCIRSIEHKKDLEEIRHSVISAEILKKAIRERENNYEEVKSKIIQMKTMMKSDQLKAGVIDIQGKGIIITLSDSEDKTLKNSDLPRLIIHASDIQQVLQDLIHAGAEAVAINDERIVTTTQVKSGGPVLIINSSKVAGPYKIKAIGDTEALITNLKKDSTILKLLEMDKIGVKIEKSDKVLLPGYKGKIHFQYSKLVSSN